MPSLLHILMKKCQNFLLLDRQYRNLVCLCVYGPSPSSSVFEDISLYKLRE